MEQLISIEECRILGVLLEKEITTPDYYPMTLNSLVNACNQKSCRDPVTAYDEGTVTFNLDVLRDQRRLVCLVAAADSRVAKYRQRLTEQYHFSPAERAILTELLLRGPQTAGELKNRAERMHAFSGSEEVAAAIKEMETRPDGPWIVLLPRLPGHKEARYQHLLGGPPAVDVQAATGEPSVAPGAVVSPVERLARLEEETGKLRQELDALRGQFEIFKSQFGG